MVVVEDLRATVILKLKLSQAAAAKNASHYLRELHVLDDFKCLRFLYIRVFGVDKFRLHTVLKDKLDSSQLAAFHAL